MADDVRLDFKSVFKFYKQKSNHDYSNIINFNEDIDKFVLKDRVHLVSLSYEGNFYGLDNSSKWVVFELREKPGLFVIRNPFTAFGQRYWMARCLQDFPRKPNKRNVDIDGSLQNVDQLWEYCMSRNSGLYDKLRWVTLGYHHNWNTKVYSEDSKSFFPPDLAALTNHFATVFGYSYFEAQAAIVNMYHPGTCLSGHVDMSEVDLDAPLFSFSFGQPAIFLIGSKSLEEEAVPLVLNSGDVMIMSQEARLSYHAVPRILFSEKKSWHPVESLPDIEFENNVLSKKIIKIVGDEKLWKPFDQYVSRSRINLNVRQVLPLGTTLLP